MCISVFIWQAHPLYPLLLLLNRDEFHNRPTKPVSWWEGCDILGGRDEVAGGTWLACTREGRLAFLTNVREAEPTSLFNGKSRGGLVVRFLESRKSPMEFAEEVKNEADEYSGFNLILTDICSRTMVYVSNRPKEKPISAEEVSPGIHVLSNAQLDTPWHKAKRLSHNFKELLGKYGEEEVPMKEMVEKLMKDTLKDEESRLPNIRSADYELKASSIFVDFDTPQGRYGTRSIAALFVTSSGEVSFYEEYLYKETWKNNPRSQPLVMEAGGVVHLFNTYSRDVDATTETNVLSAISSIFWNNIQDTASRQSNGYEGLFDYLTFTASFDSQRKALNLIHCLVFEHNSDCNIVTGLRYHHLMMKLAYGYFASVRVAALKCLLLLTQVEGGGNSDQLVKNDDKLKQVLGILIKSISAMACTQEDDLTRGEIQTREEIQLVDLLWNACYNKPSSVQGLLGTYEEAPAFFCSGSTWYL